MTQAFKILLSAVLLAGTAFSPSLAKTKKVPLPPTPDPTANIVAMRKVLQLWAYDKGGEFIGDVVGIVDSKAKKVVLKCYLKNLTGKEIHGARGVLRFTTIFGDYIGDLSLETTVIVPPGATVPVEWKAGAERFSDEGLKTFQKLKLKDMRQIWYPRMIVFTDGATLKE